MKIFTAILFCTSLVWGQWIGNVDTVKSSTYQVRNPNPAGAPIAVTQIGLEYHVMDMNSDPVPVDLKVFFPLWPDNARNLANCVRWFNKVQTRELALNVYHLPGYWDSSKSPWPYLQISIAKGAREIYTYDLSGHDVWLFKASDVTCSEVMDWRAPYFVNP